MGRFGDYGRAVKAGGNDGKYVKLEDGDSINFTMLNMPEPGLEVTYWRDGAKVPPGTDGADRNEKVVCCVWDTDQHRCRILRLGSGTFAKLAQKVEKNGEDRIYTVSRAGIGLKTRYEVDRGDRLTADQVGATERAEQFDPLDERDVQPLKVIAPRINTPEAPPPAKPAAKLSPKSKPAAAPEPAAEPDDEIPF